MKILINCFNLVSAGTLKTAYNLLEALSRQDKKNEYFVIVPKGFSFEKLNLGENFKLICLSRKRFFYKLYRLYLDHLRIRLFLSKFCPSVYLVLGNIGPAKLSVPQVVLFHNSYYVDWHLFSEDSFLQKIVKMAERYFFWRTVKNTDVFVVQSDYIKSRLQDVWSVNDGKIKVIPNAFSKGFKGTILPKPPPSVYREFLYVSRFYSHKNHFFLIPIAKQLVAEGVTCFRFVVTIDREVKDGRLFLQEVERQGLDGVIYNIGEVSEAVLENWYQRCTALFFPSLLESFGMPLIEAMGLKKPILVADLPYAHSLCGEAAGYFNPKNVSSAVNVIKRIIDDPNWNTELVKLGWERFKQFPEWDTVALHYIEILRSLSSTS